MIDVLVRPDDASRSSRSTAACTRRRSPTASATRSGIATIAVGAIFEPDHVNSIIAAGRADLCALARPHLADPYWTLHAAAQLGYRDVPWPQQYLAGRDQLERNLERAAQLQAKTRGQWLAASRADTPSSPAAGAASARPSPRRSPAPGRGSPSWAAAATRSRPRPRSCAQRARRRPSRSTWPSRTSVQRAFARAEQEFGPAAILVNNAGQAASAPFQKTDMALWQRMLAVNLTGTFLCAQAALAGMLHAGHGRIVNIASTAGLAGAPYVAAYCAAKHGVIGLTRALALEFARKNITVNAVCPGYTETDMVGAARRQHRRQDRPQRRRGARRAGAAQSAGPPDAARRKWPTPCCGCACREAKRSPARRFPSRGER